MKNIFKLSLKEKKISNIVSLEVLADEDADNALGGFREFKPNIYEANRHKNSFGKISILLDSMK